MQIQGESELTHTPVLENCAFFSCVQCAYCGYLILGGSAKELSDEKRRHAIECKATQGSVGVGGTQTRDLKCRFHLDTRVWSGIWLRFDPVARWLLR